MLRLIQNSPRIGRNRSLRDRAASAAILIGALAISGFAQSSDQNANAGNVGPYQVTSSAEFGWRWRDLKGSDAKYRSDLNYKQGFRSFDTNILFRSTKEKGTFFDTLLISNSGWGADPTGYTRLDIEKTGYYKFNANVQRVKYFNNLLNHALNEHNSNTRHTFGDFDLTIRPQSEKLRFTLGSSFSNFSGPGDYTIRAYSDEFKITNNSSQKANDFRAGVAGRLFGFNVGVTQGFRLFRDRSGYILDSPSEGNNTTNSARLFTFSRDFPTTGHAYYTMGNLQRTIAKKLDLSARLIYTSTDSVMTMIEQITGRDNSNNFVDLDKFDISSRSKRVQTRGDAGATYLFSDKFRISNTFTFDRFSVNGGESLMQAQYRRNAAGTALAVVRVLSGAYRVNDYTRYTNTLEADYQWKNWLGFHAGWRYTHRAIDVVGFDQTFTSAPSSTNPLLISESEENSTNTLIAGFKAKPTRNWVIFGSVEHGTADNVFTRLENYKFTNFKFRSRVSMKDLVLNLTAVTKDNTNPSQTNETPPVNFGTAIKNRYFSGSLDWNPVARFGLAAGYTYHHLTSNTPVIVPVGTPRLLGYSLFLMRDHYGYVEITAKPFDRLSLFATYRLSRDKGQGTRFSSVIQNIITSYPMQFKTPEIRAAIRLTRNVDWNFGYQYYDYRDSQTPLQNYRTHLPYTSLRIYFGPRAGER